MPTVTESKTGEAVKPQSESPVRPEPELFAAEIAMEEKSGNWLPILFIAGLVLVVGGAIYYFVKGARATLTVADATTAITQIISAQPAPTVHFATGTVVSTLHEKTTDPHYKLLDKAGIIQTKSKSYNTLIVAMTPAGEKIVGEIQGVQKAPNSKDNTVTYVVPLAERKLVEVNDVKMVKPHIAQVTYTWKWAPNRLGTEFDASGSAVKSFSTWDRGTLIKSYGVDFYSAGPTKATIVLMEGNDGKWKPYTGD